MYLRVVLEGGGTIVGRKCAARDERLLGTSLHTFGRNGLGVPYVYNVPERQKAIPKKRYRIFGHRASGDRLYLCHVGYWKDILADIMPKSVADITALSRTIRNETVTLRYLASCHTPFCASGLNNVALFD